MRVKMKVMHTTDSKKTDTITPNIISFLSQLYVLNLRPYGVGYRSEQLGPAAPAVSSPDSLCTPSLCWWADLRSRNGLGLV